MNDSAMVEHEASAGKISEEQMYYLATRGFSEDDAMNLVVNGSRKDVFQKLPIRVCLRSPINYWLYN